MEDQYQALRDKHCLAGWYESTGYFFRFDLDELDEGCPLAFGCC